MQQDIRTDIAVKNIRRSEGGNRYDKTPNIPKYIRLNSTFYGLMAHLPPKYYRSNTLRQTIAFKSHPCGAYILSFDTAKISIFVR